MLFYIGSVAISVWIIFFGGAKRIENTMIGYFEYGLAAEKASYIQILAWVNLVFWGGLLITELI